MELFRESLTKKTFIYLPHNADGYAKICYVLESEYFFKKQIAVCRGQIPINTVPDDKNTDDDKEAFYNENYFIRHRFAKTKKNDGKSAYLILKNKNKRETSIQNAGGDKAFTKNSKLAKRKANQSNSQEQEQNLKNSKKSSASATSKGGNKIANRNGKSDNVSAKNSSKNDAQSRSISREDDKNSSDRSVSRKNGKSNFGPSKFDRKTNNPNAERNEDVDATNSDDNRGRTKKGTLGKGKGKNFRYEKSDVENQMKNESSAAVEDLKKYGTLDKKLRTTSQTATTAEALKKDGSLDRQFNTTSQSYTTAEALKNYGSSDQKNTNLRTAQNLAMDKNLVGNTSKFDSNGRLNQSWNNKNSSKNQSSTEILQMDGTAAKKADKSNAVNKIADVENSTRNSGNQVVNLRT